MGALLLARRGLNFRRMSASILLRSSLVACLPSALTGERLEGTDLLALRLGARAYTARVGIELHGVAKHFSQLCQSKFKDYNR